MVEDHLKMVPWKTAGGYMAVVVALSTVIEIGECKNANASVA